MAATAVEPQRRCVGCGRSAAKHELLRLVAADGLAIADPTGRHGGRGAYLCRTRSAAVAASSSEVDPACLERATRRGALARALRRPVSAPPELLRALSGCDAPESDPIRTGSGPPGARPGFPPRAPTGVAPAPGHPTPGRNRLESIG